MDDDLDRGDEQPCGCRCDGLLEVFGEAAVSLEPGEGSFDDPASRQHLEAFCGIGSLDDLDGPLADAAQGVLEFVAGIASVREHMTQPREAADDFGEHQWRPVTVSIGVQSGGSDSHSVQIAVMQLP